MEYLVPALAVLVIGVLAQVIARGMARRARAGAPAAPASPHGSEVSEARARDAAALLDEAGHRTVYGHIAQSRVMEAVRAYRTLTGRSLKDGALDVQSLALHPQVWSARPEDLADEPEVGAGQAPASDPAPRGARGAHAAPETDPVEKAEDTADATAAEPAPRAVDGSDAAPLMVPTEWLAEPAPEEAPFEVEVARDGGSVHVSSRDLPPWLRDQLAAMVRDGNLESAAVQLSTHSELTVPEAFELLRRMRERREGR